MSDVFLSYKAEDLPRRQTAGRRARGRRPHRVVGRPADRGLRMARGYPGAIGRRRLRHGRVEQALGRRRGPLRSRRGEPRSAPRHLFADPHRQGRTAARLSASCRSSRLQGWKGDRNDPRYHRLLSAAHATIAGEPPAPRRRNRAPGDVAPRCNGRRRGRSRRASPRWAAGACSGPARPRAANSIAVMPFANLSGDASQAYFANGISEELRSALSQLDGLRVAGRHFVRSAEAAQDARTAARRLRVANILTGSVRRAPGVVRITSQLVEGRTGLERWSEILRPARRQCTRHPDRHRRKSRRRAEHRTRAQLGIGG